MLPAGTDPLEIYEALEAALGAPLSDVERAVQRVGDFNAYTPLLGALIGISPPPLPAGALRPAVANEWDTFGRLLPRATRLLTYAPEVVMEPPSPGLQPTAERVVRVAHELESVRGLVEVGALRFGSWAATNAGRSPGAEKLLRSEHKHFNPQFSRVPGGSEFEHVYLQTEFYRVWRDRFTPYFQDDQQRGLFERYFGEAAVGVDRRVTQLSKLAQLDLPALNLPISTLVAVRRDDGVFAEWRKQLGDALAEVELLPASDVWQRDAKAIIADELAPYTDRLTREVKRSSALSAVATGTRTFAVAGIGSAVGAASMFNGDPKVGLGAVAGSAGATLIAGLSDWVKGRREARPNRAVLQLATVFDDRA